MSPSQKPQSIALRCSGSKGKDNHRLLTLPAEALLQIHGLWILIVVALLHSIMDQRSLDSRERSSVQGPWTCLFVVRLTSCLMDVFAEVRGEANLQRHLPYPFRCDRREDCRVVRKCFIPPVQSGMQWKSMRTYGDSPDMFKKWLGVHVSDHSILWCDEPWTPSRGRPDLSERSFSLRSMLHIQFQLRDIFHSCPSSMTESVTRVRATRDAFSISSSPPFPPLPSTS